MAHCSDACLVWPLAPTESFELLLLGSSAKSYCKIKHNWSASNVPHRRFIPSPSKLVLNGLPLSKHFLRALSQIQQNAQHSEKRFFGVEQIRSNVIKKRFPFVFLASDGRSGVQYFIFFHLSLVSTISLVLMSAGCARFTGSIVSFVFLPLDRGKQVVCSGFFFVFREMHPSKS